MSRAYFLFKISPKKSKLVFNTKLRSSRVYTVQKFEWTRKPYFLVEKIPSQRKLKIIDLDLIGKQF